MTFITSSAFATKGTLIASTVDGSRERTILTCKVSADGQTTVVINASQKPEMTTTYENSILSILNSEDYSKDSIEEYSIQDKRSADTVYTISVGKSTLYQELAKGKRNSYNVTSNKTTRKLVEAIYSNCFKVINSNNFQNMLHQYY